VADYICIYRYLIPGFNYVKFLSYVVKLVLIIQHEILQFWLYVHTGSIQ